MKRGTRRVLVLTGLLIAAALLLAARWFRGHNQVADDTFDVSVARPTYVDRHPRVLIDEAHHNFHTARGRYAPFAKLLRNDGYFVTPFRGKFTREALEDARVLVIANAMGSWMLVMPAAADPPFTNLEADVLRNWVKGGGALLLVADHEPVGEANRILAERFGVMMGIGRTYDDPNSDMTSGTPSWLLFTRENGLLTDHPITRGRDSSERVDRVESFAGQSLIGQAGSAPLLVLGRTAKDRMPSGEHVSVAGRSQALALRFGAGRVVVVGEAAMLTAQVTGNGSRKMGMNWPGNDNRQFVLNLMHWLSGELN